jgi:hypothetical protein
VDDAVGADLFLTAVGASELSWREGFGDGFEFARDGGRALWLAPSLMIAVLAFGLARAVWDRMSAMFAPSGMAGGLVSARLMYYERRRAEPSSGLIATFWTTWYWPGLVASLVVAATSLWFYIRRVRGP